MPGLNLYAELVLCTSPPAHSSQGPLRCVRPMQQVPSRIRPHRLEFRRGGRSGCVCAGISSPWQSGVQAI